MEEIKQNQHEEYEENVSPVVENTDDDNSDSDSDFDDDDLKKLEQDQSKDILKEYHFVNESKNMKRHLKTFKKRKKNKYSRRRR